MLVLSASQGLPTSYRKIIHENNLQFDGPDFFSLFGFITSPLVEHTDYIQLNYEHTIKRGTQATGFNIVKKGRYIFEINLIAKGNIKGFYFCCAGFVPTPRFIEKDRKEELSIDLDSNRFVFMYPSANDVSADLEFTIEPGSYIKTTYSWKYI